MIFTLPFPIPLRAAWKFTRRGGFKTHEYTNYLQQSIAEMIKQNVVLSKDQPYAVEIYLHSDNWITNTGNLSKTAGDVDNRLKCLLDAVVNYCKLKRQGFDDSQIVTLIVHKKQDSVQKKAVLRFSPVNFS